MATYVPNAYDATQPTEDKSVESAALEFRTVKVELVKIDTVYAGMAAVTTVADDLNEPISEIETVATNIANVNAVGTDIANVNTVAGNSVNINAVAATAADIPTVAANLSDINTVAANVVDVTNFADVYLGPAAVAPLVRNDSTPLQIGDLYFSTAVSAMQLYTATGWQSGFVEVSNFVTKTSNTGSAALPAGTTAQRDVAPAPGFIRWNSTLNQYEGYTGTAWAAIGGSTIAGTNAVAGSLYKVDAAVVAFTKTGAGTAAIKAGTIAAVGGVSVTFDVDTAVIMPTLVAGTDYAIYACTDGSIRADASFSSPSGYTTANSRRIGGFHFAPGGNAAAQAGGDTTPQINEYSFWDLKFKPTCPDPRGMTLVANGFWTDIYLTGVDHYTNGTSKYNVTIANGSSPPKVPALFGGNGSTAYSTFNWWEAGEVARSHGKRRPSYDEFCALAYGTTEATSSSTDPVSTILRAAYTSKWGVMLATGNLWIWGAEFGGGAATAAWTANTGSRGSTYLMENAALFGGAVAATTYSGSRCSSWNNPPTYSNIAVSSRCACDHLIIE